MLLAVHVLAKTHPALRGKTNDYNADVNMVSVDEYNVDASSVVTTYSLT